MPSSHQKFYNYTLIFMLITISCQTIIARDNTITNQVEKTSIIPNPSIKCDTCPCDTCPCDTCPEPVPPPPPPPPPTLPSCPPPPPPPCPPPPSPPPPPKEPPCYPCMEEHSPPPQSRFPYTPGNDVYVTEYTYNVGVRDNVVMGVLAFVGVALLQLSIIL